jgi:hypothetical protein
VTVRTVLLATTAGLSLVCCSSPTDMAHVDLRTLFLAHSSEKDHCHNSIGYIPSDCPVLKVPPPSYHYNSNTNSPDYISHEPSTVDGWKDLKFGMTVDRVNYILRENGNKYLIEGKEWRVSVEFANPKLDKNGDVISGILNRITLYYDRPWAAFLPCDDNMIDSILNTLQNTYGPFMVRDMPREINGTVPDFAVKIIGSVTIKFNYIPGGLLGSTCSNPHVSYYKAGLEKAVEPVSPPSGNF